MELDLDISSLRFDGSRTLNLSDEPTRIAPLYADKLDFKNRLEQYRVEIDALQNMMYAHDRYGLLLIFQAMDGAGKDSTIRKVMSGINPHGVFVYSFKSPSSDELDHSYLWRTNCVMPERGRIHIFNRSYYEEVLVARVHPEIVTEQQKLPSELVEDLSALWEQRYEDIRHMEQYEARNGIRTVKFFLHLSKDEQKNRFIDRIDRPEKNWKFSEQDILERAYWDDYQQAYEDAINQTAATQSPWYVIPADDKPNMQLIVARCVLHHLEQLDMHYPRVDEARMKEFANYRRMLEAE